MNVNQQILEECKRGDRKAQFQLYRTCFSMLMGVCIRYKKDESEAASVLNVGFLKILNNLDKYNSKVPFQAWIKRIMINTVIDEFRKDKKFKEHIQHTDFADEQEQNIQVNYNTADQVFDAEELENLIKQLPPISQKVFNLFAIDGFSHKEIADMLNISTGTSKWHLSTSRKKLKEMIQEAIQTSKIKRNG